MGLGSVVQKNAGQGSLKSLLKTHFRSEREVPPLKAGDWMRVSRLANTCPREEVLCARNGVVRKDVVEADLMLTFLHGKALHWALQNDLLVSIGVMMGKWRCISCGKEFGGGDKNFEQTQVRCPTTCNACGKSEFLYLEQYFGNPDYHIGGHPDGFLVVPGLPGVGLLEAKSISPKGAWEIRNTPKMDHVIQVQIYLWLTGLKWAKILYWDKAGMGTSALVEHLVLKDDDTIEKLKQMIKQIWEGIAGGPVPNPICANSSCPRAKACVVAAPCFAPVEHAF
jgi:hypothetical protein